MGVWDLSEPGRLTAVRSDAMTKIADLAVPASPNDKDVVVPGTRADWRRWLESNTHRDEGLMHDRGRAAIDAARSDGSWSQHDDIEALLVPTDLQDALEAAPGAQQAFDALSKSYKKQYLYRIQSAKRPTTRAGRIEETVRGLTPP